MVAAPPTETAALSEVSFWTSNVETKIVAFDTFKVDDKVVALSTCNVESIVAAPPTERVELSDASFPMVMVVSFANISFTFNS